MTNSSAKSVVALSKQIKESNLCLGELEALVLETLRKEYSDELRTIIPHFYSQFTSETATRLTVPIERHLFVIFTCCAAAGLSRSLTTAIAYCFIKGYSIPVLLLNWNIDKKNNIPTADFLRSIQLFYEKELELSGHQEATCILKCFNDEYSKLLQEMRNESLHAYILPTEKQCKANVQLDTLLTRSFYRSSSHYIAAILSAVLSAVERDDLDGRRLGSIYGCIRQITDEMVDWKEDLHIGITSFPLQIVLAEDYEFISDLVKKFWKSPSTSHEVDIEKEITRRDGFKKSILISVRLCNEADKLARQLFGNDDLYYALSIFIEWKKAFAIETEKNRSIMGTYEYIHSQSSQILEYAISHNAV